MKHSDILKKTEQFAKKLYELYKDNPDIYETHIIGVRKFALKLAEIEDADKEVVEIAAILHDIGNFKGRTNHNVTSYNYAKKFLKKIDLPKDRKELILECIYKHRSDSASDDNKLEVKIVQSADVLARLFDKKFQQTSLKSVPKEKLQKILQKAKNKIRLKSAKEIAKPQIEKLKNALKDVKQ